MEQKKSNKIGIHNFLKVQSIFRNNNQGKIPKRINRSQLQQDQSIEEQNQIKISRDRQPSDRQAFSPIRVEQTLYNPQTHTENRLSLSLQSQIWQNKLYNSKNKYFDSCRSQALQFTDKLANIIQLNINLIYSKKADIYQMVKQHTLIQKDYLRIVLSKIVEECLDDWQINELNTWKRQDLNYMGGILQLQTRLKQQKLRVEELSAELGKTSSWRKPASQLLSRSYEDQVINLSDLCKLQMGCWSYQSQKTFLSNSDKIRSLSDNTDLIKQEILKFLQLKQVEEVPKENTNNLNIKISIHDNSNQ